MRIVVTGGSGKAGRAVVRDIVGHGHRVLNVDLVPDPDPVCEYRRAELGELGQALEVLRRADAVVHLAAIPGPRLATEEVTFRSNIASTFNVFSAACMPDSDPLRLPTGVRTASTITTSATASSLRCAFETPLSCLIGSSPTK